MDFNSSLLDNDLQHIRELGQGSYGTVHLVKHRISQQHMALKCVKLSEMDQQTKNKALNQVRLLASIDSPYIIKYQGAFFQGSSCTLNILMQFADEGDLEEKIQLMKERQIDEGFDQQFIWQVAYGILKGLKVLHENKIVHRDLKSANIFFSHNSPKIGDLNVSKVINKKLCSTQTGTPYYTCPEVWKAPFYDEKCDIWSFGVILYQLCTLRHPFTARQLPTLIMKIMKGKYNPIPEDYSQALKDIIKQCLTINPKQRPTAKQLLQFPFLRQISDIDGKQKDGQVSLLNSIIFPKMAWTLNKKLPKPKFLAKNRQVPKQQILKNQVNFRVTKKLKPITKKCIQSQCQIERGFQNSPTKIILSIKKINQSQKHIHLGPLSKLSQPQKFFNQHPSIQHHQKKKHWRIRRKQTQNKEHCKENGLEYDPQLF